MLAPGVVWAARRLLARLRLPFVVSLLILFGWALSATAQSEREDVEPRPAIHLLASSQDRILLEVGVERYTVNRLVIDGIEYDVLSIRDWGTVDEAGAPQLPMRRVVLAIPPSAEVRLRVLNAVAEEAGPFRLLPAPTTVLQGDPLEQAIPWITPPKLEKRFAESPAVYGRAALYPGMVARLAEVGFIRSQRIAAIELYPIQYNPVSGRIQFYPRFQVELSLSHPTGHQVGPLRVAEAPVFEEVFQEQLLNYDAAQDWRGKPDQPTAPADWPLPTAAYKIAVTRDGIYRLTYSDLAWAGGLDPRRLQMYTMGQEVAIRVVGEEDGHLDAEDYLLFYGQGIRHKYTKQNVYWLTFGQAFGRRILTLNDQASGSLPQPAAFAAHLRVEKDSSYYSQWPGDDSTDRWYQQLAVAPTAVTIPVDLGNVSAAMPSTLWVFMKGANNALHHARFYVNGYFIGEHTWYGMDAVESARADFDPALLQPLTNTFEIEFPGQPGQVDFVQFDRLELGYGHAYRADRDQMGFTQASAGAWEYEIAGFSQPDVQVFDITHPLTVTQVADQAIELSGTTYTLRFTDTVPISKTYLALTPDRWLSPESIVLDSASNLHSVDNGADYVLITHADFQPAALKLAAHRASQGLRTAVVDMQDVYDEFGYGLSTPEAIRGFLRYAFDHWQPPAPTYVVLLGDGTYDPKDNLKQGAVSFITPYLAKVDPWLGETATDNWYVTIAGEDIWPDMVLGRLPANSLAEANTMVDKTIAYEQSMGGKDWNGTLTFVAGRQPDPKGAGNFHDLSEAVIQDEVPPFYNVSEVYLGQLAQAPKSTCGSGTECEQRLIDALNAGTLLVNYIGHGSVVQWDGENILRRSSIDQLANGDRLAIMLPMTCLDGYFIHALRPDPKYPDYPSISELVVRTAGKGAVASWGPTGLGVAYGHDALNRGFLEAVLRDGIRELGPASYVGKLRLYETGSNLEQIQEYTVFGDPALRIHSLQTSDVQVTKSVTAPEVPVPGSVVTFTLTFTNTGPDVAHGVVLTDLIPPLLMNPTVVYLSPATLSAKPGVTFAWTLSELMPHAGGEVRIRAVVDPAAEVPISFINTAVIAATTPDHDPANNHARIGFNTRRAYLPLVLRRGK